MKNIFFYLCNMNYHLLELLLGEHAPVVFKLLYTVLKAPPFTVLVLDVNLENSKLKIRRINNKI